MLIETTSTVFLVEDDEHFRKLIALHIESAGVNIQQYTSAEDFLSSFDPAQPGCLLLDIYMPGMTGLELQKTLVERNIQIPTIIMTSEGDVATAVQAMKAGAIDYIEKPLDKDKLLERIYECLVLDFSRRDKAARLKKYSNYLGELTTREYEIMELMVSGRMNKVIADELGISQRTVEDHRAKVMEKLKAKSITDVVRIHLLSQY